MPLIRAVLFVFFATTAVQAAEFGQTAFLVQSESWGKARRSLKKEVLAAVKSEQPTTGNSLMEAVRLRALIEAGSGNTKAAEWWWHAGLNLESQGAEDRLLLVAEAIARPLRAVQVRSSTPPKNEQLPPLRAQPKPTSSPIFRAVNEHHAGHVRFEMEVGERGAFLRPLVIESTAPPIGIYAALDKASEMRLPQEWLKAVGDTFTLQLRFLGRAGR